MKATYVKYVEICMWESNIYWQCIVQFLVKMSIHLHDEQLKTLSEPSFEGVPFNL
jgi:hypothetical protein